MSDEGIPQDVEQFLGRHVHSVEQLEVLLLLHEHPTRDWSAAAVYSTLYTNQDSIARRLVDLQNQGLIRRTDDGGTARPTYRYAPTDPTVDRVIDQLAQVYRMRRITVTNLIFQAPSAPPDTAASAPDELRSFSDAFKFRKKDG